MDLFTDPMPVDYPLKQIILDWTLGVLFFTAGIFTVLFAVYAFLYLWCSVIIKLIGINKRTAQ
jgi:hypothetical protein